MGWSWLLAFLVVIVLGQSVSHDVSDTDGMPHLKKEYTAHDGRKVFVFDDFIPEELLAVLRMYIGINDNWRFVLPDEFVTRNESLFNRKDGIPWKSWLDPQLVRTTKVGKAMEELVRAVDAKVVQKPESKVEINEIYTALIRRGDRTMVHTNEKYRGESYHMAIYNNIVWRKNSYGETLFYDEDDEIFAVVRSKFGRLVVWDSSISVVFRPPSIKQVPCQSITVISFSANSTKNKEKRLSTHNFLKSVENPEENFLSCHEDGRSVKLDLDKHLTLLRENRGGHVVSVFDGLFPERDLDALRAWTIKYGKYYFDDSLDVTSDNVQWIAGINVADFLQSTFWPVVKRLAAYLSGKDTWHPYDVACNLIRSTDHTRFHLDTSGPMQEEMTFLLYLSPNWTANDCGETAFMETNDDSAENEYVAEVVPYYGRAVLFDGNFPHSARPPSAMHYGPRYTLAVKLAATKVEAFKKMFSEEPRHEEHVYEVLQGLKRELSDPPSMVARVKLRAVGNFLMTKNVQRHLRGDLPQQHNQMEAPHGESENDEQDPDTNPVHADEEAEPGFSPQDHYLLKSMAKYYKVENVELEEAENMTTASQLQESKIFMPGRRKKIFQYWFKKSESMDQLDDYLELYLKQRQWFRSYAARQLLTML